MSLRHALWIATIVAFVVIASFSAPAFPQENAETEEASASRVEQILKEQEHLLRGQRFSYEPGNRRDPFLSLYEIVRRDDLGPRPKGIGGMYIDEVDLNGIIEDSAGGDLAYVTGSDNKGYFMRVGQSVYDGYLFAIDAGNGTITFRQKVDDPRQIKPYRDVVRRLVPQEDSND